jgi:predicted transcriptional regulator
MITINKYLSVGDTALMLGVSVPTIQTYNREKYLADYMAISLLKTLEDMYTYFDPVIRESNTAFGRCLASAVICTR